MNCDWCFQELINYDKNQCHEHPCFVCSKDTECHKKTCPTINGWEPLQDKEKA